MTQQRHHEEFAQIRRNLIMRGAVAIVFGALLLLLPGIGLRTLVLLFGAYSLADGIVAVWTAFTGAPDSQRWWLVLQGVAGVAVGIGVFLWTGLTALILLYVIGSWAIVLGIVEIIGALSGPLAGRNRVLLGLHGVLGIAFGLIMWLRPGAGALALIALIAAFAISTGVTRLVVGFQLRSLGQSVAAEMLPSR